MSNEYNDWLRDRSEEAKELVAKYPFLRFKNHADTEEIESCWMFDLPVGWQIGFGEQMCDELMTALGDHVNDLFILEVKEKFGEMRIYYCWERSFAGKDELHYIIKNIIDKYTNISYKTCVHCGKPADVRTLAGWIVPYCNECYNRQFS